MPELPDVELLARRLRRAAAGRTIRRVRVLSPATIRSSSPAAFSRFLRGRRIEAVERRGKYLLIRLSSGATAVAHLRMTGDFEVVPARRAVHPHTRVIFNLGAQDMRFVDQRRFGHIDLVPHQDLAKFAPLASVGMEPLSADFTFEGFRALMAGRRGTVKSALLRQDLLAGIGNLYADEILWRARIAPTRAISSLAPVRLRRLYRAVRTVLKEAVRGLSRHGRPVGALLEVRESDRPCPRCGRILTVSTVAGRTTYACSRCQR